MTPPLVALAGSPNCGKTALFNALTGSHQKVANYPGVTVERKEGEVITSDGTEFRVLDLPGTYSLDAHSPDEEIARSILFGKMPGENRPSVLIAVADATCIERCLAFVLELLQLETPIVLALNMMDIARKRGFDVDLKALSSELGIPVIPTVAVRNEGVLDLVNHVGKILNEKPIITTVAKTLRDAKERYAEVDRILKLVVRKATGPAVWTERLDRIVLHPVLGILVLISLLALIFQGVFTWAQPFMDLIESGVTLTGSLLTQWMPEGTLRSLLIDGILAGVGSILVFLPQILILFFFILVLEDSGYLARAAFLIDRVMHRVGLHGRAFLPLLSSFACAIPGIMAARTIENPRDRLTTILIAPLMTCSARLPVYTLLIAAFVPNQPILGPFRLQGLVMMGLYVAGIASALAIAFIFKRTLFKGANPHFLLEIPSYKLPNLRNLAFGLKERAWVFLRRAGTIILALSILLWFLASYPKNGQLEAQSRGLPAISGSYAGRIGQWMQPALAPLGFDWRMSIALVPGFAAREVMVSALGTVYALEYSDDAGIESALTRNLGRDWSLATALSVLAWYVYAPQCLSTLAVVRREANSWKWAAFLLIYLTVLAYLASLLIYRFALWLGLG